MNSLNNEIVMNDSPDNGVVTCLADFGRTHSNLHPLPRVDSMAINDKNTIMRNVTGATSMATTGGAVLPMAAEVSDAAMQEVHQPCTATFATNSAVAAQTPGFDSISCGTGLHETCHVVNDPTARLSLPSSGNARPVDATVASSGKDVLGNSQTFLSSLGGPDSAMKTDEADWEVANTAFALTSMHFTRASISQALSPVTHPTATRDSGLAGKSLQAEKAKKAKSHLDEARDRLNQTLITRNAAPILPPSLSSPAQQFRYLEGVKVSSMKNKARRQMEEEALFNELQVMVVEEVRDLEILRAQCSAQGRAVSKSYLLNHLQGYAETKDQSDCSGADALLEPIFAMLNMMLEECTEI